MYSIKSDILILIEETISKLPIRVSLSRIWYYNNNPILHLNLRKNKKLIRLKFVFSEDTKIEISFDQYCVFWGSDCIVDVSDPKSIDLIVGIVSDYVSRIDTNQMMSI